MNRRLPLRTVAIGLLSLGLSSLGLAQTAAAPDSPVVRLRGDIVSATADGIVVRNRAGGENVALVLPSSLVVAEVYPIRLQDILPNSFIGTAALPQADGSLRAIAVTVFPESARGSGEGHRPFDLQPDSSMTNATVADVVSAPAGRTLQLRYRDGQQTVVVPPDAPVVTFRPAGRELLVPGASVSLTAQEIAGQATAIRINAGRNGFVLPY